MITSQGIEIVRTVADLRTRIGDWRASGQTIGLVPTMGALHDGHLSLVRKSVSETDRTCATLFVNPKQFNPNEDLASYPRDEAGDISLLKGEGTDLLFAPEVREMYPPDATTEVRVPGIGDILEGECRPGFFTGVATVVAKLLLQALPDKSFFGEKDYQQLLVIKRLTADLDIPVEICGVPTVREADGLAMSSRNAYLAADERAIAPALFAAISGLAEAVRRGDDPVKGAAQASRELVSAGFAKIDYVTVRNAGTLEPVASTGEPARILAAAFLGKARLIDNVAI